MRFCIVRLANFFAPGWCRLPCSFNAMLCIPSAVKCSAASFDVILRVYSTQWYASTWRTLTCRFDARRYNMSIRCSVTFLFRGNGALTCPFDGLVHVPSTHATPHIHSAYWISWGPHLLFSLGGERAWPIAVRHVYRGAKKNRSAGAPSVRVQGEQGVRDIARRRNGEKITKILPALVSVFKETRQERREIEGGFFRNHRVKIWNIKT